MSTVNVIDSYVHAGRVGVLVELSAESDSATRTDQFKQLTRDLALHITAMAPESLGDLLSQPFIKDPSQTVGQLLSETSRLLREQLKVTRFIRWDGASGGSVFPGPPVDPVVLLQSRARA
jgi:translation elongation factor EF-Ts